MKGILIEEFEREENMEKNIESKRDREMQVRDKDRERDKDITDEV